MQPAVAGIPTRPVRVEEWRQAAPSGVIRSIVAALVFAIALGGAAGVGFLIAYAISFALLLTVGVTVAARAGSDGRAKKVQRLIVAVAGVVVLAGGALRAAGWVFGICLVGALLLGSLALTGGTTLIGTARASGTTWVNGARRGKWALRGLSGVRWRASAAVLAALVVVALVLRAHRAGLAAELVLIALLNVGGYFGLLDRPAADPDRSRPRLAPGQWTLWPSVVAAVLVAGAVVESAVAHGGEPASLARRTFAVLAVVAVGVGVMIAAVHAKASISTRRRRLYQRLVLGTAVAAVFGYAYVALRALDAYVAAEGLTRARLLAYTAIAFTAGAYLLVAAAGIRLHDRWLPRGLVALATVTLIALAAVNPDAVIARVDVGNALTTVYPTGQVVPGTGSLRYVASLSADAVDQIERLPEPLRSCVLATTIVPALAGPDRWYDGDPGRAHARAVLREHPIDPHAHC